MARSIDLNRPRCIVCDKPIAKRYKVLWFQRPREAVNVGPFGGRQEAIVDGTRINDTFYLANPPRTKEEAQRFSNHTIQRIIGMHNGYISGATYWDGESYIDQFFDRDRCAVAQGYASAQHGHRYTWSTPK